MARGQAQSAQNQLNLTNQLGQGQLQQSTALENKLIPGYENLMKTGYFNPAEEAAATTRQMGATTAPFETAKFQASNRAAATRNPANIAEEEEKLALEEGQAAGNTAASLQEQKIQNQLAGTYGLTELQRANLGASMGLYGLGPSTLQARAAGGPGFSWSAGIPGIGQVGGH
jgi:hypothetical protein